MAARGKVAPSMIITALSSAFFEWVLIFMLFIDGSFGYLITKFAQYCQLQIPCLFCSRLDHVLGKERTGFNWDLICYNHKMKISSLVLCHLHNNLVDIHGMCEKCLFSFETVNKPNMTETYRSLVGKLGAETRLIDEDRNCFCCKEQCISKGFDQKLLRVKSVGSEAEKEIRNRFHQFPLIDYKKVKIASESESDAVISDNDGSDLVIRVRKHSKQDSVEQRCIHPEPQDISEAEDLISEKSINPLLDSQVQLEGRCIASNQLSAADADHGLKDINFSQDERDPDTYTPSELVSIPEAAGTHSDVPRESLKTGLEKEMPKGVSDFVPSSETPLDSKADTTDTDAQMATSLDLGDAYKLATSGRIRQLSGKFLKQMSLKGSTQNNEDLMLLLSQFSANRGIESSLNDISSKLSVNSDEFQRRISLERNESNISLDGSTVSEIEGESMVDRLRRQVEHDKRFMSTLYKELEEERSASAVAANQAMAMITRLQEEKAALQMEALQWVRVMEEQADFDSEALQKANENIIEMEKMIQDLQAELQVYKKKYGDTNNLSKDSEDNCESNVRETRVKYSQISDIVLRDTDNDTKAEMASSLTIDFENEKLYIMRCLKKLEEKMDLFSNNASADTINSEFSTEEWVKVSNHIELDRREDCQGNSEIDGSHSEQYAMREKGMPCSQENELSTLTDRLKFLEAEYKIIQHSINSLSNGEEGLKLIQEIAGYLRNIHLRKN